MSNIDGMPKLILENESMGYRTASEIKYRSMKDSTMKFIGHV